MLSVRTDLAVEAHRLWQESAGKTTRLPGVKAREERVDGFKAEWVEILDDEGEKALGKKRGTYITMDIAALWKRDEGSMKRAAQALAALLAPMLPGEGTILVAGLGNRALTADALGCSAVERLLVTRHLGKILPMLRPVAAMAGGVLGQTGMEAAEWVRGITARVKPAAVVLVDALAAREVDRLCNSIQLTDTGLTPGSGVGNHRMALGEETVGVPVVAMGVPTVVEAGTLARDILAEAGLERAVPDCLGGGRSFFVTPENIDLKIRELSRLVGYGISLAAQPGLAFEDLMGLVE